MFSDPFVNYRSLKTLGKILKKNNCFSGDHWIKKEREKEREADTNKTRKNGNNIKLSTV